MPEEKINYRCRRRSPGCRCGRRRCSQKFLWFHNSLVIPEPVPQLHDRSEARGNGALSGFER